MKNILIVFFLLTTQLLSIHRLATGQVLPSFPDEKIWTYESFEISSEVKSIKETLKRVSAEDDSLAISSGTMFHFYKNPQIKKAEFFDKNSKQIRGFVDFDTHGRIKRRESIDSGYIATFTYDDENGISKKNRARPDLYGIQSNVIQYDLELLKPKIEERYREDMLIDSTVYSYNSQGDLKSKIVYNTSGYGIILDSSFTGGEEKIDVLLHDTTRFEYEYNQDGKIVTKTEYRSKDPYKQYSYSQQGDTLITIQREFKKYNDPKWQVEEVTKEFADTTVQIIYLQDYDDIKYVYKKGRLVSSIRLDDKKITEIKNHSYQIITDDRGNWIKMKHFKDGELVKFKKREIEYWN